MTKKSKKAESFIRTPGYPGGRKALNEFLRGNLKYPKEAMEKGIEGKVQVKFVLNQKGNVIDAKVKQGIGYGCDEEALRVIKLLKFKAVKNRGVKATFEKSITIPFNLQKKKTGGTSRIVYNLTPSKEKKTTYTYSIQIKKNK